MAAAKKKEEQFEISDVPAHELPDRKTVITELFAVRREIALIEAEQLKALKERRAELENFLKATLEVGEKASFVGIGTVAMTEEIQPSVTDWDALYEYIADNNAFYFLQRKVNAAPFRELISTGAELTGVTPVSVRKLSVRKT